MSKDENVNRFEPLEQIVEIWDQWQLSACV